MMRRHRRRGQAAIELAILIAAGAVAAGVLLGFLKGAVSSRMKSGADTFGHGLLYGSP